MSMVGVSEPCFLVCPTGTGMSFPWGFSCQSCRHEVIEKESVSGIGMPSRVSMVFVVIPSPDIPA